MPGASSDRPTVIARAFAAAMLLVVLAAGVARAEFTMVIDPGHGGRDGGAIGQGGTMEKNVTLDFSLALASALREVEGMSVELTRSDDAAVSLRDRVALARETGASLLLSVHADSIAQSELRGASIYTLSEKATDRVAKALVAREALSDELAGLPKETEQAGVEDILLDLMRQETEVFSRGFAGRVVVSLANHTQVIRNPHRSANFQVLRAPDVPSVLIELGYLSNREDEAQLRDPAWLQALAGVVADAIIAHAVAIGAIDGVAVR